jgi:hypothetical protein
MLEYWNIGIMGPKNWDDGILERWINGKSENRQEKNCSPIFQYSIVPLFHLFIWHLFHVHPFEFG